MMKKKIKIKRKIIIDFFIKINKKIFAFSTFFFLNSCYTVQQGYYQIKLLTKRQKLSDVIKSTKESEDRLEKLKWVPKALEFAKKNVGLETGQSYQSYISLKRNEPVVYVVQAARQDELKLKTWWFPIVGSQPYLGFFVKDHALKQKQKLDKEGFDTSLGGVQAFSLLGYFPDPLYSSMLDGNSIPELVEIIFHESVHQTVYIPNEYVFNENFADFIAKKATIDFIASYSEFNINTLDYWDKVNKELKAQLAFQAYLPKVKSKLNHFYNEEKNNISSQSKEEFLIKRSQLFKNIEKEYLEEYGQLVLGTRYESRFSSKHFNNALFLSYEVYESKQKPFEDTFVFSKLKLKEYVSKVKKCLDGKNKNNDIWKILEDCFKIN